MARDVSERLKQLNQRRRGYDGITMDNLNEVVAKSAVAETYEGRSDKPHTKYALGAMQEVDPDYTRVGIEDATRVGKQLEQGLRAHSIAVHFDLQGSVPLNIHIRGVSDVDLLTLHSDFVTVDVNGAKNLAGHYSNYAYSAIEKLSELRTKAEAVLADAYPKATVDKSGSKAIKISGGSIRRSIDVVPSHWHDTAAYQSSYEKHDRGVKIFDKSKVETLLNMPFKHIKLVHDRDGVCSGGLKKTIRLCKNVKADAAADGTEIVLTSFDIAGLMYHVDLYKLMVARAKELSLLAVTQQHLDFLCRNLTHAMSLRVPDGSRAILDASEKVTGLMRLSSEIDELASQVAREQAQIIGNRIPTWDEVGRSLEHAYVP